MMSLLLLATPFKSSCNLAERSRHRSFKPAMAPTAAYRDWTGHGAWAQQVGMR